MEAFFGLWHGPAGFKGQYSGGAIPACLPAVNQAGRIASHRVNEHESGENQGKF
jgi:hypothetical protein